MPGGGTVCLLFTDFESSTSLLRTLGDHEGRRLWQSYLSLLRSAARERGGREVKSLGDGLMVAFDSTRDALTSAIEMARAVHRRNLTRGDLAGLQVRIGLHVGEPIQEKGDYFGTSVVVAKRLCECANGGQILVSGTVRGVAGQSEGIEFVDRGLFPLKGFSEQWRLYEVLWEREETPAAFTSAALGERTAFVAREKELATLRKLLEQADQGQGGLVMIGGEPGIGKTRLAEEIASEARERGFFALTGHCYDMEGASSYAAFLETLESAVRLVKPEAFLKTLGQDASQMVKLMPELARLSPDIPPPPELPPEQERRCLFNSFRDFLARAGQVQPLFLILEDLQWAEHSDLLLLHHIALQLHEMSVLVIGTYRDVELDIDCSLTRVLQDLLRQRLAVRVELKRLPKAAVSAMLRSRTGREPPRQIAAFIYRETDGNPFLVEEVFNHLVQEDKLFDAEGQWRKSLRSEEADIPRGVSLLIGKRLERLSEATRRCLAAAAVIGRRFSFDLLRELVDLGEDALLDALEEAERAYIISYISGRHKEEFAFSHELIRQTLIGKLSLPRRQRFHLRVANAIEEVYADALDEFTDDLAHHLYQAGAAADPQKTVRYLSLAGEQALRGAAFEDALSIYDDALSLELSDNERTQAEFLFKRGLALRSLGRWDDALVDWRETLAIYEKMGDSEAIGNVCAEISVHLLAGQRWQEAYDTARRGIEALGERVNAARCLLLAAAGFVLSYVPAAGYHTANDFFTQALDLAYQLGDERLEGPILCRKLALHHVYWQGREQAEIGLKAAEQLRATGKLYEAAFALSYAQIGMNRLGRLEDSARIYKEVDLLTKQSGNDIMAWFANLTESRRQVAVSANLDRFEKRQSDSIESLLANNIGWIAYDYTALGMAQFWKGNWEKAAESFKKGAESEIPGMTIGHCVGWLLIFTAYVGDEKSALAIFEERRNILPQAGQINSLDSWAMLEAAIEALAVLGKSDEVAKLYPLALEAIGTGNLLRPSYSGLLQTTAAIAATAAEQWDEARNHFETALSQAHQLPHKIEQPEVRRWYAQMLIKRNAPGDCDKARSMLKEAIAMYTMIGMPKHQEMAEALLAKI